MANVPTHSSVRELRDPDEARQFLLQSVWLQRRMVPPHPANLRIFLEWALEIASLGKPLPPIGFVADLGVEAFDMAVGEQRSPQQAAVIGLSSPLARAYEDQALGKITSDWSFDRAKDALKSYAPGRDRTRGLAFVVNQIRSHCPFDAVFLSPSIIRSLIDSSPEETLKLGLESIHNDGLMPYLVQCYESIIAAARRSAVVLAQVDVEALENRIALADESQQLAHQMAQRARQLLFDSLPARKLKPLKGRFEVPTRVLDEDTYPVGGFTSISTRGSIESLLQSQLAYMETDVKPDLFDMKYLRDELYYYARDENQFLRRRRTFIFALYPDLAQIRFKDPDQSFQRIVYLLGMLAAGFDKLEEWLSTDSLRLEFVFLYDEKSPVLRHEYELLELMFRDEIENDLVHLHPSRLDSRATDNLAEPRTAKPNTANSSIDIHTEEDLVWLCRERSRRSLCHLLTASTRDRLLEIDDVAVARLILNKPNPILRFEGHDEPEQLDWVATLERLLQIWI